MPEINLSNPLESENNNQGLLFNSNTVGSLRSNSFSNGTLMDFNQPATNWRRPIPRPGSYTDLSGQVT